MRPSHAAQHHKWRLRWLDHDRRFERSCEHTRARQPERQRGRLVFCCRSQFGCEQRSVRSHVPGSLPCVCGASALGCTCAFAAAGRRQDLQPRCARAARQHGRGVSRSAIRIHAVAAQHSNH
eukprot:Amastigsp_a447_135.p4 type:complete len:122 gc:universal Amastigsp_a447_135:754-389(-)